MSIDAHIDSIIKDCVAADPALAGREAELRPIVRALLKAKPDTRFDAAFAARLREQVLAETAAVGSAAPTSTFFETLMKRNPFVMLIPGGAALGVLLAVVLSYQSIGTPRGSQVAMEPSMFKPAGGVSIAMVGEGAFGQLSSTPSNDGGVRNQAGGGGPMGLGASSAAMPSPAPVTDAAISPESGKMMIAPGMPSPEYVSYRYVYKGELPPIEAMLPAYRRVKGFGADAGALDALRPLAGGLFDLGRLQGAKVQSFNAVEDREFGYSVYVDAIEGTLSLSQNWLKWPHPENACRDEACWKQYQMTPSQLPADESILDIANRFLADYGISRDAYGTPEVRHEWRGQLYANVDQSTVVVPDSISVVYPLQIAGTRVDDESGTSQGLVVSVNMRHSRVDGVWGLMSNAYEASQYAAETDVKRLQSFIERGGLWGWSDPNAKTVDVELGAPEMTLTRTWSVRADGMGEEILVPALRFAVLNPPADQPWFRKAVVIPLTKQTLDAATPQDGGGVGIMPVPTPLMVK